MGSKIKKLKTIGNFGIFKNFVWDTYVKDNNGGVLTLKDINIIYGINYSGKTTLSRILQSFEYKVLPDKFENPEFEIELGDGTILTQNDINTTNIHVKVFNEDFINRNFRFFYDPNNEDIEPFAVIGEENVNIENEIKELEEELGSIEPEPTGLYKQLKEAEKVKNEIAVGLNSKKEQLRDSLTAKAKNIKLLSERFGHHTYDYRNIKKDIELVRNEEYQPLSLDQKQQRERLIKEEPKSAIPELPTLELNFSDLKDKVKNVVERKIVKAEKIEELVKYALLDKWVKDGKDLHQQFNLKVCAFCGNPITESRWEALERHFDEEYEKLENEIEHLINDIDEIKTRVERSFNINKDNFYSNFQEELDALVNNYKEKSELFLNELDKLRSQLERRKSNIFNEQKFIDVKDYTNELQEIFESYEKLRQKNNDYTNKLEENQKNAKKELRLYEVYQFLQTINYERIINEIHNLEEESNNAKIEYENTLKKIDDIKKQIEEKKALLKNERLAANKINDYLNKEIGHPFLSLRAVEKQGEFTGSEERQIRFKIFRGNKVAYNLSEGEKRLIAFCYFMARIQEAGSNPQESIIWIDDPISSLDSNHIFFIYSLINSELIEKQNFLQLFISTHNLSFLKYLHRVKGDKQYLFIERKINKDSLVNYSLIKLMPKYLKEYITEFIYLFEQIYISAKEEPNDQNYHVFYNFGNNARKFLEIYLFYKYPDIKEYPKKNKRGNIDSFQKQLKRFFDDDSIIYYFINRPINEMSHGNFERGEIPIEFEEIKKIANLILEKIEEKDNEQYQALKNSIGVVDEEDENN